MPRMRNYCCGRPTPRCSGQRRSDERASVFTPSLPAAATSRSPTEQPSVVPWRAMNSYSVSSPRRMLRRWRSARRGAAAWRLPDGRLGLADRVLLVAEVRPHHRDRRPGTARRHRGGCALASRRLAGGAGGNDASARQVLHRAPVRRDEGRRSTSTAAGAVHRDRADRERAADRSATVDAVRSYASRNRHRTRRLRHG